MRYCPVNFSLKVRKAAPSAGLQTFCESGDFKRIST